MSATLTWQSSGAGVKTGVTNATFIDDLDTLVSSFSGNALYLWEKAGKSNAGTPRYLLLRRKDGSAGRLAIIIWDSAPAANNTAILDTTPLANGVQVAWFPAGTGTTLSNLTAASGTICGNDTGVVKCASPGTVANVYIASFQVFYFENAEGIIFCTANPAAANTFGFGAGALIVDGADVAYDCTFATSGAQRFDQFGSPSTPPFSPWTTAATTAGTTNSAGLVRTNYGSANRVYYHAYQPTGTWAQSAVSATDVLTDTASNRAWFMAPQLMGVTKGEGPVLKWRQLGYGPATLGALTVYNLTGPVVAARSCSIATAGVQGGPWVTNFKI